MTFHTKLQRLGAKPLRIMFDEIDRFVKIHIRIRYLALFDYGCVIKVVIGLNIL